MTITLPYAWPRGGLQPGTRDRGPDNVITECSLGAGFTGSLHLLTKPSSRSGRGARTASTALRHRRRWSCSSSFPLPLSSSCPTSTTGRSSFRPRDAPPDWLVFPAPSSRELSLFLTWVNFVAIAVAVVYLSGAGGRNWDWGSRSCCALRWVQQRAAQDVRARVGRGNCVRPIDYAARCSKHYRAFLRLCLLAG
jgi:hypothetical protein